MGFLEGTGDRPDCGEAIIVADEDDADNDRHILRRQACRVENLGLSMDYGREV